MDCDRAAQVHAYHDDALAPSQRVALETHLETCADCRELRADLRCLSNLIAAASLAAMSPETMARLSTSGRGARDRGLLRIASWLTAAAAAILVGALLFVPERNGGTINQTVATNTDPLWETVAVMPPQEADEAVPEIVALATWMANDLSADDFSAGDRQ